MKKHLIILSTLALSVSACDMHDHDRSSNNLAPGEYEQTLVSTDAAGTKVVKKASTEVKVDKSGNKKTVVESKVTKDPKGLLNKTTLSKTKDVEEEKDGKTITSHEHEENQDTN